MLILVSVPLYCFNSFIDSVLLFELFVFRSLLFLVFLAAPPTVKKRLHLPPSLSPARNVDNQGLSVDQQVGSFPYGRGYLSFYGTHPTQLAPLPVSPFPRYPGP